MNMKGLALVVVAAFAVGTVCGAEQYTVSSPDGKLRMDVSVDGGVSYAVSYEEREIVPQSVIGVTVVADGKKIQPVKVKSGKVTIKKHSETLHSSIYTKSEIADEYNEMAIAFKEGFVLKVRAYDTGVAYRWVVNRKKDYVVSDEEVSFGFAQEKRAFFAHLNAEGRMEAQLGSSFENTYKHVTLGEMEAQNLCMLPIVVEAAEGLKVALAEADVEDYPNMNVYKEDAEACLSAYFAAYPKAVVQGGHKKGELLVTEREDYIAKGTAGEKNLPWRILAVAKEDGDLLENDLIYCLSSPSRLSDESWIRPGQSAWDWWNDWGLTGVDFEPGINTRTYKEYIDFASEYGIPYVIIDDGWEVDGEADLFKVVPEMDLKELVSYADARGVGIILWATYYSFYRDMEDVCKHYSEMGIRGFKIDFMNRDDAVMVSSLYEIAATAAKYELLVDFHGVYKPAGMNRTYPNVLNFEGVAGLEQNKWATIAEYDQVTYDVTVPFLRMFAGPMDYTQGAMLNGTKRSFRPSNSEPMSQGTRVHQMAQYVVFFSPLCMLCDSPSLYERNSECTEFITGIPCVWDETKDLGSKVGEYVAVARRSGETWYVGVLGGWDAATLEVDLSEIGAGGKKVEVFEDGTNADKRASDYAHRFLTLPADGVIKLGWASGGGCVMRIE